MSFTKYFKPYSCVFVFMHGHSRIVSQNFAFRGKKSKIPIQKLIAAALTQLAPCFNASLSLTVTSALEHLILCMEKVVEAAPQLPLFYYHIPSMTGVTCEFSLYNQLCLFIRLFMSTLWALWLIR